MGCDGHPHWHTFCHSNSSLVLCTKWANKNLYIRYMWWVRILYKKYTRVVCYIVNEWRSHEFQYNKWTSVIFLIQNEDPITYKVTLVNKSMQSSAGSLLPYSWDVHFPSAIFKNAFVYTRNKFPIIIGSEKFLKRYELIFFINRNIFGYLSYYLNT